LIGDGLSVPQLEDEWLSTTYSKKATVRMSGPLGNFMNNRQKMSTELAGFGRRKNPADRIAARSINSQDYPFRDKK
jgi:hypothetical protein